MDLFNGTLSIAAIDRPLHIRDKISISQYGRESLSVGKKVSQ
jgi:hypothetical protein